MPPLTRIGFDLGGTKLLMVADGPRGRMVERVATGIAFDGPALEAAIARFLESQQELLTLRDRIVLDHPRLLQGTLAVQRDLETQLATGLAQQRGLPAPDTAALLEAGVGLVVLRVALRRWRSEAGGSLVHATAEVLDEFAELTSRSHGAVGE